MEQHSDHGVRHHYHSITAHDSARIHAGDVNVYCEDGSKFRERECLQAFKTSIYEGFKNRNPNRVAGTCQWVLSHPQFQQWRHSKTDNLLWISADPGCGKSVLAKSLVDQDLREYGELAICYFFFKDNDDQNKLATALCAVLHQLFTQQSNLIRHALASWEKNGDKIQHETDELWRILLKSALDPAAKSIVCVIDALDECHDPDRRKLISYMCDFLRTSALNASENKLKVLITSRPYESVQRWFEPVISQWPNIRLRGEDKNQEIHQEINLVIEKWVQDLGQNIPLSIQHQNSLRQQLLQMQHRTYLWLHLAIEEIRETYQNSLYPEEEVIDHVPPSIDHAYERVLQKITAKQKPVARKVLLIIVGARRPLKLGELVLALAASRPDQLETEPLVEPNTQLLEKQIRQWCGLFVFIQQSTLFLIHQTAKEFLLSSTTTLNPDTRVWRGSLTLHEVDTEMAKLCSMYLCVTARKTKLKQGQRMLLPRAVKDAQVGKPQLTGFQASFFQYCSEHWASHLQDDMAAQDPQLTTRIIMLCDVQTELFKKWFTIYWMSLKTFKQRPRKLLQQHIMALNGHTSALKYFYPKMILGIDARDISGRTPLWWAAHRGHASSLEWLLEKGAKVNIEAGEGYGTALYAASLNGHEKVVDILIRSDADINAEVGLLGTALQAASSKGHEKVVQILLENGAEVNRRVMNETALQAAALEGYEKVVQLLLSRKADVNAEGGHYGNAIQAASYGGHAEIVQHLLDNGANLHIGEGTYGKALQAASLNGHKRVAEILLENGANPNDEGGYYGNALQAASSAGHKEMVKLLLVWSADVNKQGGYYGNALNAASSACHEEIVCILMENGAEPNAKATPRKSPFRAAPSRGQVIVFPIPFKLGAKLDPPL